PITREEMTSVIVRLAEKIRGALLNKKDGFTDASSFAPWTAEYIAKAAGEGIVTGNPDGSFNARGNATRAEAAVMIKRFRDLLNQAPRKLEAGEYHPVYGGIIYEVDLQKMIDEAYARGEKTLTLEKGVYRLTPQGKGGHLRFVDMKDFTLDGNGSTLLYQSPGASGIHFENSENIHLKNLQTDCEKLSFYQAKITAINPEDFSIDFVVPNGYRDYFEDKSGFTDQIYIEFHEAETGDYIDANNMTFSKLEKLGNRQYRMFSATASRTKGLKVGDYIAGGHRTATGVSVNFLKSKQCALTNYTIWSGQVGLFMSGGYGDHRIDNVRLEPGPRPLGAIDDRVFSTVADAAHIQRLEVGPKIYNSRFCNMGDDGFNNYGRFYRAAERISDKEFVLATGTSLDSLFEGDTLRLYSANGDGLGDAKVASITELPNYVNKADLDVSYDANSFSAKNFYRIKLETAVKGVEPGSWITNASRNCSGFEIKNCYYGNIRSRGILIKGSDGVVEGNTIYNTGSAGILLAPEFNWMEAGFVRNVVVRNNTLIQNGDRNQGAIYVYSMLGRENRDITIEGNTIRDCAYEAMDLTCIKGLIVRNNVVESRNPEFKTAVPVLRIDKVEDAEVYGNTFPEGWTEIEVTEDTKNIVVK
ncbi:MAG: S-layer homology domain-containing protein, partial [Clostridia bacterium]|nr:S-layer homology domain-containing protein [Clostridia bacterium]